MEIFARYVYVYDEKEITVETTWVWELAVTGNESCIRQSFVSVASSTRTSSKAYKFVGVARVIHHTAIRKTYSLVTLNKTVRGFSRISEPQEE